MNMKLENDQKTKISKKKMNKWILFLQHLICFISEKWFEHQREKLRSRNIWNESIESIESTKP